MLTWHVGGWPGLCGHEMFSESAACQIPRPVVGTPDYSCQIAVQRSLTRLSLSDSSVWSVASDSMGDDHLSRPSHKLLKQMCDGSPHSIRHVFPGSLEDIHTGGGTNELLMAKNYCFATHLAGILSSKEDCAVCGRGCRRSREKV